MMGGPEPLGFIAGKVVGLTYRFLTQRIPGYNPLQEIYKIMQGLPDKYRDVAFLEVEPESGGAVIVLHAQLKLTEEDAQEANQLYDEMIAQDVLYRRTLEELRLREKFGDAAIDAIKRHLGP